MYNVSINLIKRKDKAMSKSITLEELKQIEREEYEEFQMLLDSKIEHSKKGEFQIAKSIEESERWKRGRWSMICDLIERLEK